MVVGGCGTRPRADPAMDPKSAGQRGCISAHNRPRPSVRPPFSPWPEVMCFQSDPASGLALYALKDLKDAGRLKVSD